MKDDLLHLLSRASGIRREEDQIRKLTAADFTIFQVLGITGYEASTHTPFIAALLDPKGAHGQGERFLEAFLDQVRQPKRSIPGEIGTSSNPCPFDCASAKVLSEYHLGPITDESGGRADIYLSDDSREIIIENKIHAHDQESQLLRYFGSGRSQRGNNPVIIYLTLEGTEPEDPASKNVPHHRLSYRYDILEWLDQCLKVAQEIPTLRESLLQYRKTVRIITDTDTSWNMEKKIADLVTERPEHIEAFFALQASLPAVLRRASDKFKAMIAEWHQKNLVDFGWTLRIPEDLAAKDATVTLSHENLSALGYAIGFNFERRDLNDLTFGFCRADGNGKERDSELKQIFESSERLGRSREAWEHWPVWRYFPDDAARSSDAFVKSVCSGKIESDFADISKKLVSVAESLIEVASGAPKSLGGETKTNSGRS